jgi:hypothetical protein
MMADPAPVGLEASAGVLGLERSIGGGGCFPRPSSARRWIGCATLGVTVVAVAEELGLHETVLRRPIQRGGEPGAVPTRRAGATAASPGLSPADQVVGKRARGARGPGSGRSATCPGGPVAALGRACGWRNGLCCDGRRGGAADCFSVARDPVRKRGPWADAASRVATPSWRSRSGRGGLCTAHPRLTRP